MSVIIPNGYAQVVLGFSASQTVTGRTNMVLGFGGALGPNPTDYQTFAQLVANSYDTNLRPLTDTNVTLTDVSVIGPTQRFDLATSLVGAVSADGVPPNTCALVTHRTPLRGRRAIGRTFWYGVLTRTQVGEDGIILPARVTQIQQGWINFILALEDPAVPGVTQVILQHQTPVVNPPANPSPPLSPPPPVVSNLVSNRAATQRRRLRR